MTGKQESLNLPISEDLRAKVEAQIEDKQKVTDYDIREYPVEVIVDKYNSGSEIDERELFVPDYQRELVWSDRKQARFIESLLLNLPIPYLFVADNKEAGGRLEIVDGTQRIRTLVRYMENDLKLEELELLPALNGFYFRDLPPERQRRFKRKTLRMIELTQLMDEEARRQLFDRLNSGGEPLVDMEQRMGGKGGKFLDFVEECATSPLLREVCPIGAGRARRREYEEFVLRFFAYLDRYQQFDKQVNVFLDDYLKDRNTEGFDAQAMRAEFVRMLEFVKKYFPYGFRKKPNYSSIPRIRFEMISVGSALALRQKPDLVPKDMSWLDNVEFSKHTRSDASNSRPKVINRINFVRDHLLGKEVESVTDDK